MSMNQQKDLYSQNPKKRLEAIESIEKTQDISQIPALQEFVQKEKVSIVRERAEQAIRSLEALASAETDSPEQAETEVKTASKIRTIPKQREFRRVWEAFLLLILINSFLFFSCYAVYFNKLNAYNSRQTSISRATEIAALATTVPIPTITSTPDIDAVNCLSNAEEGISILDYIDYPNHPDWTGEAFQFKNGSTISIPVASAFNLGEEDFSLTIHYQAEIVSPNYQLLFDRSTEAPAPSQGIRLFINQGKVGFQMADANVTDAFLSDVTVMDRDWHTVTITLDRDNNEGGKFYIDGNPGGIFNPTQLQESLNANVPLHIGGNMTMINEYFQGKIASLEFFPCIVLSPEQVLNQAAEAQASTAEG